MAFTSLIQGVTRRITPQKSVEKKFKIFFLVISHDLILLIKERYLLINATSDKIVFVFSLNAATWEAFNMGI